MDQNPAQGITRRRLIAGASLAVTGTLAATALAACGETQKAPVAKEVPAEVPAEKVVTSQTAAPPQAGPVKFEFTSDWNSGPRGKLMQWALERYAILKPNHLVRFLPNPGTAQFRMSMAAKTNPELALLGGLLGTYGAVEGAFTEINDVLAAHPDFKASDYYFVPDWYTMNFDANQAKGEPPPALMNGPQFGMPFQGAINGILMNLSLGEAAGVEFPAEGWSYESEYLESAKKVTDPETGTWGTWARNQCEFQWGPMCLANGSKAYRNAEETELALFDDGGETGLQFATDLIHKHKVSFPVADTKQMGSEFGSPFASNKVWSWFTGRVYSSGYEAARIKDRFRWSLAPLPVGTTGKSAHYWTSASHIVTGSADRRGTTEAATDFAVFMAGPVVSERMVIDRGAAPFYKAAFDSPSLLPPPPEGMKWLAQYFASENIRNSMVYLPNYHEYLQFRAKAAAKAMLGEGTAEQGIQEAKKFVRRVLADARGELNANRAHFGFPAL